MTGPELEEQIEKYLEGKLHGREKELMEQWLDSEDEEFTVNALSSADKSLLLKKLHSRLNIPVQEPKQVTFPQWLKWAASFLIVALASYYIYDRASSSSVHTITATNDTQKILLTDGSIVWLKDQSTLTYPEEFTTDERHVQLQGEALFEVTKDPSHPFIIRCGDVTARVLGTSFNLKTENGNIELKVLTGKVNLSSTTDAKGIDVTPNQKIIYTGSTTATITTMNESEAIAATATTEYNMKFDHTAMSDIISKVQKKFDVRIKTDNDQLIDCTINADLTDQSLSETMRVLADALEFEYEISNGTVTLKGGGCQ